MTEIQCQPEIAATDTCSTANADATPTNFVSRFPKYIHKALLPFFQSTSWRTKFLATTENQRCHNICLLSAWINKSIALRNPFPDTRPFIVNFYRAYRFQMNLSHETADYENCKANDKNNQGGV